jgi:DNA repair photolyase
MGPVVPFLSDSPAQLDAAVRQIAAAGATHVMPIVLHLRPGTREWFFAWLRAQHPELVDRYLDLYGHGAYAPKAYQNRIAGQVRELADKHGIGRPRRAAAPGHQVLSAPRPPDTHRPQWAAQPLTAPGNLDSPAAVNRRGLRIPQGHQAARAPRAAHPALSSLTAARRPQRLHRSPALPPPRNLSATAHETGIQRVLTPWNRGFMTSKQARGAAACYWRDRRKPLVHIAVDPHRDDGRRGF